MQLFTLSFRTGMSWNIGVETFFSSHIQTKDFILLGNQLQRPLLKT